MSDLQVGLASFAMVQLVNVLVFGLIGTLLQRARTRSFDRRRR